MSAQAPPGPIGSNSRNKRFSRLVSRVKNVLKGKELEKSSTLSNTALTTGEAPLTTSGPTISDPAPKSDLQVSSTSAAITSPELEKAKRLAQQYGIELDVSDWQRPYVAQERVEKPIRLRIHRICHVCNTDFGPHKTCTACRHQRCAECLHTPFRKKSSPRDRALERGAADEENLSFAPGTGPIAVGESATETIDGYKKKKKTTERYAMTIPSKTGGQDLVRKRPMQRVRRHCHECNTLYIPPNKTCTTCSHVRCSGCPRDPPKRARYPYGYPNDAEPDDPALSMARYGCHVCQKPFAVRETVCGNDGHERCGECVRIQPRKVELELDPEVLGRVNERLERLMVDARVGDGEMGRGGGEASGG